MVAKWLRYSPKVAARPYLMSQEHHFRDVGRGDGAGAAAGGQTDSPGCDAFGDAAGRRAGRRAVARNDRIRGHHSGCHGFFGDYAGYQNGRGTRPRNKPRRGHGWAGGREMAETGRKQPSNFMGENVIVHPCDAKCDAISADRVELLARAVILVAGMAIPEMAREAVLAQVVAELTAHGDRTRGEGKGSRHAVARMTSR